MPVSMDSINIWDEGKNLFENEETRLLFLWFSIQPSRVDIKGKSADSFFLLFMMVDPEGIGENFSFIPILALTGDLLMELEEGKDKQILARRGCDEANSLEAAF